MQDYSLADIVEVIGAPRRSVQHWVTNGVIRSIPTTEKRGTGTHRRFSRDEMIIGCLIYAFARQMQAPVGVLLRIAALLRDGFNHDRFKSAIQRAIRNEDVVYITMRGHGAPRFTYSMADGPHLSIDLAFYESRLTEDDSELHRAIGRSAIEHLSEFGAVSYIICANSYLEGLRS
jgi:hypothetical protein